jgi:hypothetical protein
MFRFTIRDVLWLTVVVAICCMWVISSRQWQSRLETSEAMAKHFQKVATHHQQRYLDLTRAIDENRQRMNARNSSGDASKNH